MGAGLSKRWHKVTFCFVFCRIKNIMMDVNRSDKCHLAGQTYLTNLTPVKSIIFHTFSDISCGTLQHHLSAKVIRTGFAKLRSSFSLALQENSRTKIRICTKTTACPKDGFWWRWLKIGNGCGKNIKKEAFIILYSAKTIVEQSMLILNAC